MSPLFNVKSVSLIAQGSETSAKGLELELANRRLAGSPSLTNRTRSRLISGIQERWACSGSRDESCEVNACLVV